MYMIPRGYGDSCLSTMKAFVRDGGLVACYEADVNFGCERYPPPPPLLGSVLKRLVAVYRDRRLLEWRSGLQLWHHLRRAALRDVRVEVVDGRIIAGGKPDSLVRHGCLNVEELVQPCLEDMGLVQQSARICAEWRAYLSSTDAFLYTPVFLGTGVVSPHCGDPREV